MYIGFDKSESLNASEFTKMGTENNEISVMLLCQLNQLRLNCVGNVRTFSHWCKLASLLIAPNLRWCLVDLRDHMTDGKTHFLTSVSSHWLVNHITN